MISVRDNPMGTLGLSTTSKESAVSFEQGGNIFANKSNNKISEFLNDSYNLTNTLVHESQHKSQTTKNENRPIPLREIDAIGTQMNHSSYSKTTKEYQKNTMNYLIQNITETRLNDNRIQKIIDVANSKNNHYQLQFHRYGSAGDAYQIKIIEKK